MTTLIVSLPPGTPGPATQFDHVLTHDGHNVASHSRSAAALLPAPASSAASAAEVVALVPAAMLSWHQVTLPKNTLDRKLLGDGGSPRVRTVLEGLLEERVLDDTAQLHFALAPASASARADEPVWVAVCDRTWLRDMLNLLERAGRAVTRIVPLATPDSPLAQLVVSGDPLAPWVTVSGQGAVNQWPLCSATVALVNWPSDRDIVAEPAVAAVAETAFGRPVQEQHAAQHAVLAAQTNWDLAQFEFVASDSTRFWKRISSGGANLLRAPRWRAARWAVGVVVGVNLVALNAWAWKEQASLKAKQRAVQEMLTSTFPAVKVVVDAPVQMVREVDLLRRAVGHGAGVGLERVLGAIGPLVPMEHRPSAIDLEAGETRLRGMKMPAEVARNLIAQLQPMGFEAQMVGDMLVVRQGAAP